MGRVPAPCIALKHGAGSDKPALFSISEKTAIDAEIPGMTNSNAWPTPQGWILIRDSTTFLQNPQDPDEKIHLPHLPEAVHSRCASVLSVKPMIPGCVVLLVEPEDTIIWYCRIGQDEEWARHEYDIGTQPLIPPVNGKDHEKVPITSIAACQGKFYFNGRFDSISVLEFTPAPTFSFIAITEPLDFWGAASVLLVESESELYMVSQLFDYYLEYICDVTVHKMDFSKHQWCTAEDIGGHAFLIASRYFGASRSADECGLEKDCVYAIFARDNYFEVSKVEDGETEVYDLIEAPDSDIGMWILPIDSIVGHTSIRVTRIFVGKKGRDGNISGVSSSFGESILLLEEEKKIHDAVSSPATAGAVVFPICRSRPRPELTSAPIAGETKVFPIRRRRRSPLLPQVIVKRLVEMKGKYSINNNYT
uniref:KIB1-4 beta-propeller domain-containing protein n=1 Tax=Oryza punctata TaxID=4537 RepID=A0A0E0JTA5_ORYPU